MKQTLFLLTILVTHVIQGVTGFAGTLLAMPLSLRLVGIGVAVPVLNALGLASGVYVYSGNRDKVNRGELKKVLVILIPCMLAGTALRHFLAGQERVLYIILGVITLLISVKGLYELFAREKASGNKADQNADVSSSDNSTGGRKKIAGYALLVLSGLVHGMFVCGGPLLIGYMKDRFDSKDEFRATLSTVWIFLNGILMITHLAEGLWTAEVFKLFAFGLPVLFLAMYLGTLLYKRMSQRAFTILTYILLILSGISLFFK